MTFEDEEKEIETISKIGFIEFDTLNERIPLYMHILGRMLKRRAESFWDEERVSLKKLGIQNSGFQKRKQGHIKKKRMS